MAEKEPDNEELKLINKRLKKEFKQEQKKAFEEKKTSEEKMSNFRSSAKKILGDNGEYEGIVDIVEDDTPHKKNKAIGKVKLFGTMAAIAVIAAIVISSILRNNTFSHFFKSGVSAYERGNYNSAIDLFRQAQTKDEGKDNAEVARYIADSYIALGKENEAVEMYKQTLEIDPNNANAVVGLAQIYMNRKDVKSINELLDTYRGTTVEENLADYNIKSPSMEPEGGQYFTETKITLTGEENSPIYYTLDGSDPTIDSSVYTKPIVLSEGDTKVKAMSVSRTGIKSAISEQEYKIEHLKPAEPKFSPATGVYLRDQKISLTVPEGASVYYTFNGSTPTRRSYKYYNPISAYGTVAISAVAIDEDGNSSSVVTEYYVFVSSDKQLEKGQNQLEKYIDKMKPTIEERDKENEEKQESESGEVSEDYARRRR